MRPAHTEQLVEQGRDEVRPPEPQVVELLRIRQPPDAVMREHQVVPGANLGVRDGLGRSKWSLITLNTTLSEGRVNTAITIPRSPSDTSKRAPGVSRCRMSVR